MYRNEPELRRDFPEFVDEIAGVPPVVRDLDAGYSVPGLPQQLRTWRPRPLPGLPTEDELTAPSRRTRYFGRALGVGLAGLLAVALTVAGMAASSQGQPNPTDLGHPQEIVPKPVLGAFKHRGPVLKRDGKPVVTFLGTKVDEHSGIERWPLVKALDQFGTFRGVSAGALASCYGENVGGQFKVTCYQSDGNYVAFPTPDLEHATYASRYVALDQHDVIDDRAQVRPLSGVDRALFDRYVANLTTMFGAKRTFPNEAWNTASSDCEAQACFPLVLIDGYLQTGVGMAIAGDVLIPRTQTYVSYPVVQASLRAGYPKGEAYGALVHDINAEANIITALICHADGRKPESVCKRPSIRRIMRNVK